MTNLELSTQEKKFLVERLNIEIDWGLEVYSQEDLDLMTGIVKKLSEGEPNV